MATFEVSGTWIIEVEDEMAVLKAGFEAVNNEPRAGLVPGRVDDLQSAVLAVVQFAPRRVSGLRVAHDEVSVTTVG